VRLEVVSDGGGNEGDAKVLSEHPLLIESAVLPVSRCRYPPTLMNGTAVEVVTEVTVNYQLAK